MKRRVSIRRGSLRGADAFHAPLCIYVNVYTRERKQGSTRSHDITGRNEIWQAGNIARYTTKSFNSTKKYQ